MNIETEGVAVIKKEGKIIAIVYKDTTTNHKHCVFYGVNEMGEDEIKELLNEKGKIPL